MRWGALLGLITSWACFSYGDINANLENCQPVQPTDQILWANEYYGDKYSEQTMTEKFQEIYNSGKRLNHRAYYSQEKKHYVMPWAGSTSSTLWVDISVPQKFFEMITSHIESALKLGAAKHVFFPDMGHSHLFLPQDHWDIEYREEFVTPEETPIRYSKMFTDKRLLVHYHTAEKLKYLDDDGNILPGMQFRRDNRNPVGDMLGNGIVLMPSTDTPINTVGELAGHRRWGAGFAISASKDGCFEYTHEGQTYRYDMSFFDSEPDPNNIDPNNWIF